MGEENNTKITKKSSISLSVVISLLVFAFMIGGLFVAVQVLADDVGNKVDQEVFEAVVKRVEDKLDMALKLNQ